MKPRVAIDVSFCADLHVLGAHVTGVGRVIENIVRELAKSPDLEILLTGCHGHDPRPSLTSANTLLYHRAHWRNGPLLLDSTVSRSTAFERYAEYYARLNALDERTMARGTLLRRKVLNALVKWDTHPRALDHSIDLFHSPFRPLPSPEHFSGPGFLTVHDLFPLDEAPGSYNRSLLEKTLRSIDPKRCWVMCVSEYTRNELLKFVPLPFDRIVVTPLAAEPVFRPIHNKEVRAAFLAKFHLPDAPFFLSVSNPQPRKNIPFMVRCFQEFAAAGSRHQLLLAGSRKLGWGHDAVDHQIARVPGLENRIHFLGTLTDEELAVAYSLCTAFVFPSLQEGFGLPPLEAMQCGAPVICSNTTSLPEVTGDAAISLDPTDLTDMVGALRNVAEDEALRSRLSAASIARAGKFSWTKTAQIVEETYRQAWRQRNP